MLAKIPSRDTQTVVSALIKQAKKLLDELYKSLTWDRGKELTNYKRYTMTTNTAGYFCDPQSPWQRGPISLLPTDALRIFRRLARRQLLTVGNV